LAVGETVSIYQRIYRLVNTDKFWDGISFVVKKFWQKYFIDNSIGVLWFSGCGWLR
jgi:hypothetical protein